MDSAYVAGAGIIPFGKFPELTLSDMGAKAGLLALKDAGIDPCAIDAAFFANGLAGRLFGDSTVGQNVFWELGIHKIPVLNVENACTSGSSAFFLGYNMVAAGQAGAVMVIGAEKMCVPGFGLINSGETEIETRLGLIAPAGFAMRAKRYMEEFNVTPEQLAQVAVKNRQHAGLNPNAQYRTPITVDDIMASPMIVDPLTRLQCCPIADGAAAVIICSPEMVKQQDRSVKIESAVLCSGSYGNHQDMILWETDARACRLAYEKAGIGPEDMDVIECHDAFTISEILHYEALDLCGPGEGVALAEQGHTRLGGRIPVNVSGGLLSRGHPVGATGVAQIVEIVTQLRNESGERQVEGAKTGLAHCMGGDKAGDTKSCSVAVFSV